MKLITFAKEYDILITLILNEILLSFMPAQLILLNVIYVLKIVDYEFER